MSGGVAQALVSYGEMLRAWGKIGCLSFGGPAGQIAMMHRLVVEEKHWLTEAQFLHALNYCMLLPGPEAQQLATYIGWMQRGTWGGLLSGLLFILPGVAVLLGLSVVYALFGSVGAVGGLFFGLKAAVLAVVLEALRKVGLRALRNRMMIAVAVVAFLALFVFDAPFPAVVLGAGALGWLGARLGWGGFTVAPPTDAPAPPEGAVGWGRAARVAALWGGVWLAPVAALWASLGRGHILTELALMFSKLAAVTFGGAYAVLAYVAQEAAEGRGWISQGAMLDGLGLAETTPGPLILVLQFVGFLAAYAQPGGLSPLTAGMLGAAVTVWVTFAPCFLWIFLGAPYVERLRGHAGIAAALSTLTAAVVGVIGHLALWFGLHVLFARTTTIEIFGGWGRLELPVLASVQGWSLALTLAAALALTRFRLNLLWVLAAAAGAGMALQGVLPHLTSGAP